MEKKKIEDKWPTILISGVTSGLLSGLIGSCCCCLPVISGVAACWLYTYMVKEQVSNSGVMILAALAGFVSAVPSYLVSLLSQVYFEKNISSLPPEFAELSKLMQPVDLSVSSLFFGFMSVLMMNTIFSFIGSGIYLALRKK